MIALRCVAETMATKARTMPPPQRKSMPVSTLRPSFGKILRKVGLSSFKSCSNESTAERMRNHIGFGMDDLNTCHRDKRQFTTKVKFIYIIKTILLQFLMLLILTPMFSIVYSSLAPFDQKQKKNEVY